MNQYDMLEAVARWSDSKVARLAERCAETEGANG